MKAFVLMIFGFLISFRPGFSQTSESKSELYQKVIATYQDSNLYITNETLAKIEKFDIDGNFKKWFYRKSDTNHNDTFSISGRIIDVNPIKYSQTINDFLRFHDIDTINTAELKISRKYDNLNKYIHYGRLVSWKKAPWRRSAIGNIFKKKQVFSLSTILFNEKNTIAVVKIISSSKSKLAFTNLSKIIVFRKEENRWSILGTFDQQLSGGFL